MRRICGPTLIALTAFVFLDWSTSFVLGVDLESFEFNDANFTELDAVANTANPSNQWSTDIADLTDSFTDGAGDYVIKKFNDEFADNFLQIDNIDPNTSGSRFIVAEMSGWEFFNSVPGDGEEIRFAFLDNDTGTSGSAVTAEVRIDRNTDTEAIELRGLAGGVGSSDISDRATLNTAQSNSFTMVLELNKTSNTYEVFYKDGSNPSQSLGMGAVVPTRDGNSIRFVINNNFGSTIDEFLSIDRVALTDTNPLTDLLTLEIHRTTGVMKLINTTGAALSGLESYSLTSAVGALDSDGWKPITDNYDNIAGPGNGSVDMDDDWATDPNSSTSILSESSLQNGGADGGDLTISQEVILSMGGGPWIKNPTEDLQMELMFTGGVTRRANVNFVGNGGERHKVGDLNFDGSLTVNDWTTFIAGAETDLSGMSVAQAYQKGDLNDDGANNIFDFAIFKDAYNEANGLGSFEAMIAGVPEPSSLVLISAGAAFVFVRRRRNLVFDNKIDTTTPTINTKLSKGRSMKRTNPILLSSFATVLSFSLISVSPAGISEDFQFGDSNGTLLADTTNSVVTGDDWDEDSTDMLGSSVLNGVYRVQKDNEGFGTNFLDTMNFTSGKAWLVAEIAGWNFTPTLTGLEEAEQIRFAFLENDGGAQGGSTITGQTMIQRNASDGIELVGRLTTGAPEFGPLALTHSRTDPFIVVLEIDEDSENYSVYYKDDSDPFVLLGTAPHVAGRDGNSVRFVANNSFTIGTEFFDIDRLYVTDEDPINISQDLLTLQVDLGAGNMSILNDTSTTFEIDSYRIESTTDDLVFANWSSFSDQNLDPTDGPDPNSIAGDGIGETWDEAGGSDDGVLAESFLLGKSVFGNGRSELLGNVFDTVGDPNSLAFQYRNADTGAIVSGNIEFVTTDADFDGDNFVTGLDFLIWQGNIGLTGQTDNSNGDADGDGTVDGADLVVWEGQYGTSPLISAVSTVPEPMSCSLLALALATTILGFRKRPTL